MTTGTAGTKIGIVIVIVGAAETGTEVMMNGGAGVIDERDLRILKLIVLSVTIWQQSR